MQEGLVRGATDQNHLSCPGPIVTIHFSYFTTEVLVRDIELISYHQPEEFGKGQKERRDASPYVLKTSQTAPHWHPSWLNDAHATRKDPESEWLARDNQETNRYHQTWDFEPHGRTVLLASLTLLLATCMRLPNKVSCFVSLCHLGQFISKC